MYNKCVILLSKWVTLNATPCSIKYKTNNIKIFPYILWTILAILKVYEFIHPGKYRSLLFLITVIHHHDIIFTILVYRRLFIFVYILSQQSWKMNSNVKACMSSEIHKLLHWGWPGVNKTCKNTVSFLKNMVIKRYANHVLPIFKCKPQHYIHTVYCYKTLHYKRHKIYKYIQFINTLPYRITTKHVITLIVNCPNTKNEKVCKLRSNIKDICILNTIQMCFKTT